MEDPLDSLRRRLYESGSTAADVEAYRAAEAERLVVEPPATPKVARRRGRRGLVAAGVVLLVAAGVALVVVRPAVRPAERPAPAASGIAAPVATRARFAAALDAGRDPGLLDWLNAHPKALLASLRSAGRADSTAFTGAGPTTMTLSPTTEEERAGHLTVVLVTDRAARYVWRATVVAQHNDRSGPEPPVAAHEGGARRGAPVSGTVGYDGGVPTRLTLLLPTGVRWAAVVVYTD
ncbi:hypothetical protein [Amnibacterium kyonggiense]|uniref:Uncharacterized protein n=1 Tax=Amnibacterium kyonggiense TaxID=595671 RepID=A0A4R7FLB7_9MICO|nr:hypothetical protein [Amnibacterium kyonggiense]TDS77158.1 hypothetical protein CLV52_2098 [Amnibacterium kyonggiense]